MPVALVTGSSTGIGRATTLRLARQGWRVLAGVRKASDGEALVAEGAGDVHPVMLDVTEPAHLEALGDTLAEHCGEAGLDGLVNNAGFALARPIEVVDLEALRHQLEVNVVGVVAVTQRALPALRQATGRIVNIGSTGSRATTRYMGPYTASKHALVGINDALRQEVRDWGIEVVLLEPGAIATPIWDKGKSEIADVAQDAEDPMGRLYPEALPEMTRVVHEKAAKGIPPEAVADVVWTALTTSRPRARYPVGWDAVVATFLGRHLPPRWMDEVIRYGR